MSWLSDILWQRFRNRFSKPENQARNRKYVNRALSAYGYGNHQGSDASGERYFIETILSHLAPDIAFDVGANVGDYSRALLSKLPDTTVYAFEPLNEPMQALRKLSSEFGERFIPVEIGIGDTVQDLEIHFDPEAHSQASFAPDAAEVPYVTASETRMIPVTTLDAFCQETLAGRTVDFIKIDTEGFEAEVLAGAKTVLTTHRPKAVQIEFNWHHMFRGHSLYLLSKHLSGYEVFQLVPNGMARRDAKDPLSNLFMFSNFVFLREDVVTSLDHAGLQF